MDILVVVAALCAVAAAVLTVVYARRARASARVLSGALTRDNAEAVALAKLAEEAARELILEELEQLAEYEEGHVERQQERFPSLTKKGHRHRPLSPHGTYDPDQRRQHLAIRLRQRMAVLPTNLEQLLIEMVPDRAE